MQDTYTEIYSYISARHVQLIAVSKTKPTEDIMELYQKGQRMFGENKVQEMVEKHEALPKDIQWHIIGHLQKNKVKYIAPFVFMIQSADSLELLQTINKEAAKNNRTIPVLLQMYIAREDTKFGLTLEEAMILLEALKTNPCHNIDIKGVMGMASFTDDMQAVREEFKSLKNIFITLKSAYFSNKEDFREISMGMSGDYKIAIEEGSTMVRVGSAIFGKR